MTSKVRLPGYERDEYGNLRAEIEGGYVATLRQGALGWTVSVRCRGRLVVSCGAYASARQAALVAAVEVRSDRAMDAAHERTDRWTK